MSSFWVSLLEQIAAILYLVGLICLFGSKTASVTIILTVILFVLPGAGAVWFAFSGRGNKESSASRTVNLLGTTACILLGVMMLGLALIILWRKL